MLLGEVVKVMWKVGRVLLRLVRGVLGLGVTGVRLFLPAFFLPPLSIDFDKIRMKTLRIAREKFLPECNLSCPSLPSSSLISSESKGLM